MKLISSLLMIVVAFFLGSIVLAEDSTLGQVLKDTKNAARQFGEGYNKSQGHTGDKLIEGLIESTTPEADEQTRRVQRDAIKFAVDPNSSRSEIHLDNMMQNSRNMVEGTADNSSTPLRDEQRPAGKEIRSEKYDLDDNQIPTGWHSRKRYGRDGFSNGRYQIFATDTTGGIGRSVRVPPAAELIVLEYDGNFENSSIGMTQFVSINTPSFPELNFQHGSSMHSPGGMSVAFSSVPKIKVRADDKSDERTYYPVICSVFHYIVELRNGGARYRAYEKGSEIPYFDKTVSIVGFDIHEITGINFMLYTTTEACPWIDNLEVKILSSKVADSNSSHSGTHVDNMMQNARNMVNETADNRSTPLRDEQRHAGKEISSDKYDLDDNQIPTGWHSRKRYGKDGFSNGRYQIFATDTTGGIGRSVRVPPAAGLVVLEYDGNFENSSIGMTQFVSINTPSFPELNFQHGSSMHSPGGMSVAFSSVPKIKVRADDKSDERTYYPVICSIFHYIVELRNGGARYRAYEKGSEIPYFDKTVAIVGFDIHEITGINFMLYTTTEACPWIDNLEVKVLSSKLD